MIGNLKSRTLRTALACGASVVAMVLSPAAHAQSAAADESAVYMLRYASEYADGAQVVSQSKDILAARERTGDRSMMVYDDQNGVMTVERGGKTLVAPMISHTGPERSYAFDYGKQTLNGADLTMASFNVFVRPMLVGAPAPGIDGRWTVKADLKTLGIEAKGGPVSVNMSRTYLQNAGKQVALVEFDVPAFSYVSDKGETVTHWAKGFAVADAKFGEIHALATQHRASAMTPDGTMRPISVRTSMHGVDASGGWRMSFKDAPQIRAAMKRVVETAGDNVHPTASGTERPDSLPLIVARRLDFAAFGMLEGGANPIPTAVGPGPTAEEMMAYLGKLPPAPQITAEQLNTIMSYLAQDPIPQTWMMDRTPGQPVYLSAEQQQQLQLRTQVVDQLTQTLKEYNAAATSAAQNLRGGGFGDSSSSATGGSPSSAEIARLLDYLSLPPLSPGQVITVEQVKALQQQAQLIDLVNKVMMQQGETSLDVIKNIDGGGGQQGGGLGGTDGGPFVLLPTGEIVISGTLGDLLKKDPMGNMTVGDPARAEDARKVKDLLDALQAITDDISNKPGDTPRATNVEDRRKVQMLLDAIQAITDDVKNDAMKPRVQDGVGDLVGLPLWMDPNSPDAAQYDRLLDELQREMDALRAKLKDADKGDGDDDSSGFGDDEDFYENNAFEYGLMMGTVATDLSRWAEWLATQNVRELERLARLAGYPNLASALADAGNIIRQAEDPGYRQWAMQAPSCAGYAGCGPNYLERWWMKQAIVSLGDILADSRGIFSSGGFSDIGISGLNLHYLLRDHAVEDGDIVQVRISQFGKVIYQGQVNLTNLGQLFDLGLQRGVASIEIFAVNEGALPPNTAQITVDDVVRGQATQTYSLQTGETATLRVEAGAKPGASTSGTSGAGQ